MLNHDTNRDLGSTKQGNLELHEDNIGLRAKATITDADVIEKAKRGDLVGWSFGFSDRDVEPTEENGVYTRNVKDLDLYEVSILDRSKVPAYDGTIIQARDTNGDPVHLNTGEVMADDKPDIIEEKPVEKPADKTEEEPQNTRDDSEEKNSTIDYGKWEKLIAEMKED